MEAVVFMPNNKQNVLIVGLVDSIQLQALNLALQSCSANINTLHHITKKTVDSSNLGSITYNPISYDAVYYLEPNTISNIPVDAEILDALAHHESMALKIFDRIYPKKQRYRYFDLKRHLYYTYLSYWVTFFTENKINKIIFHNVPHEGYDYVIYILAKYFNIPVRIGCQIQVTDSYVISSDIETLFSEVKIASDKLKGKSVTTDDLSPRMQQEYQTRSIKTTPFYMRRKRKNLIKQAYHHLQRRYIPISERDKMMAKELVRPSLKYVIQPDLAQPYVYFGLHYQPEMTTAPLGGVYTDQFLAIQLISNFLPDKVQLYIKEHPAMYNERNPSGRFAEFYEKVSALPNVQIISQSLNSFELIERSLAVATITGTVGWEALFLEKPVFVFGNIFYKYCPGAYPIFTSVDMEKAMQAVFLQKAKPTEKELIKFLKALDNATINGILDDSYLSTSLHSDKDYHSKQLSISIQSMLAD